MTDTTTRRTGPAAIRTGEILTGAFHLTEGGSGSGFPARSLADLLDLMRRSHYPIALSALVHDQEWPRDVPEGWQAGPEAQGWQSYTLLDDTRVVAHVGTVSELDPHRHPYVYSGSSALLTWGRAFGVPYHGTPGVAGTDVLRAAIGVHRTEVIYRPDKRRDWVPDLERLARVGLERDYVPTDWCATGPLRDEPTITLDANMAYLAAAITADLPAGMLHHYQGAPPAGEVGYHLVELEPWWCNHLPDPAGYRPSNARPSHRDAPRWITTPTLRLINELQQDGIHGGARVLESWTARSRRVTRPWGGLIRDVIYAEYANTDPALSAPAGLIATLKAAYRETIGLMGRQGGRVYRPDWQSIIIAQSRATLWRKIHKAWTAGANPLSVNVDAVTFAGTTPPDAFPVQPGKLGAFKVKGAQPAPKGGRK
jgi:hypothetical protein